MEARQGQATQGLGVRQPSPEGHARDSRQATLRPFVAIEAYKKRPIKSPSSLPSDQLHLMPPNELADKVALQGDLAQQAVEEPPKAFR